MKIPKCPDCGSAQLDYIAINTDALKCRVCGRIISGLELMQAKKERDDPGA
jgi:ribosomal protein S27E